MKANERDAFYFHADASAFGGILQRPLRRTVATRASASLPQCGGFVNTHVRRFDLDGLVSLEAAHVIVSGDTANQEDDVRTISTATIERLNILEVVTADRIVAQLSVMHPRDRGPAEISFNGTQFVNLRVNGVPLHVEMDRRFSSVDASKGDGRPRESNERTQQAPRFNDLLHVANAQHKEQADVQKQQVDKPGSRFSFADPATDLERKGTALCSLVQATRMDQSERERGCALHIPDFGNIFLGQLLLTRFSAQLTMLRVELGCMAEGDLSACTAYSNGRFMP